jgi:hypothetical protein
VVNLLGISAIAVIAGMLATRPNEPKWRAEFPAKNFPKLAVDALGPRLLQHRVLSTDQWGDYLIYRLHPDFKAFIDGRSDFYDPTLRDEYLGLMNGTWRWRYTLDKHRITAALLPLNWALATTLKIDPSWTLVYDDGQALYFERATALPDAGSPAEPQQAISVGRGQRTDTTTERDIRNSGLRALVKIPESILLGMPK